MKLSGEFGLVLVGLQEVDVDIEAAAAVFGYWVDECVVCFASCFGWRVDEGFAVFGFLAGRVKTLGTVWTIICCERKRSHLLRQGLETFVAFQWRGILVERWIGHRCTQCRVKLRGKR